MKRQKGMTTEDEPSGQKVSNMILGKNVCVSHSVMSNCLKPHELCVAHQAPLSMVFSRQEYWSGLPFAPPGIFLTQGSNLCPLHLLQWHVYSLPLRYLGSPLLWGHTLNNSATAVLFHP